MGRITPLFMGIFLALAVPAAMGEDYRYTGKMLRDPFTDPGSVVSAEDEFSQFEKLVGQLKIEGILYDFDDPKVIIDGKIYGLDEKVGKVGKIARIEREGVALESGGKEFFIQLTGRKPSNENNV